MEKVKIKKYVKVYFYTIGYINIEKSKNNITEYLINVNLHKRTRQLSKEQH